MSFQTGEYDYVIVGAGSAGCVVAARLASETDAEVVLLEAGGMDNVADIEVPLASGRFLKTDIDWNESTDPEPGLGGRTIDVAHGRVLGGSSTINSMVYMRGRASDYDEWAKSGASGWSYQEVLPYFRRAEDNERGATAYHGSGGPLSVTDVRFRHPLSFAFLKAAEEAGYPSNSDFNGPTQEGFGFNQVTMRGGRRWSTAKAYLEPARERKNLHVMVETRVQRIIFDGNRAVGVDVVRGARQETYRARREVIISAGAYHSPQLLMLSGIGPADELRVHGIEVRQDLPVGRNLQDHFRANLTYQTNLWSLHSAFDSMEALGEYKELGSGPLASNVAETTGFIRSRDGLAEPDFQLHGAPAAVGQMVAVADGGFSIVGFPGRPVSRGHVTLRSADPFQPPRIVHNYLVEAEDRRVTIDGVRHMLAIADRPAFRGVVTGQPKSAPSGDEDSDIVDWVRNTGWTTHHPSASCAMGQVVDHELKVFGVEGLRVVDASVMPSVPCGNTNAPTIMVAEKAVDLISESASVEQI